jgi:hypothetical protein
MEIIDKRPRSAVGEMHESFKEMLSHRYFIRVHMAVMLSLVGVSGILASRLLLALGLRSMALRYPFAILFSYLFCSSAPSWAPAYSSFIRPRRSCRKPRFRRSSPRVSLERPETPTIPAGWEAS